MFNALAWYERVTAAIRRAEDEGEVKEIWARQVAVAKKLSRTKHAELATKAHELARERLTDIRKAA